MLAVKRRAVVNPIAVTPPAASFMGPLLAGSAALCVAMFGWHGADLPNQEYRLSLFRSYGFLTFDTFWYGGHYFFTYSLLVPLLAAVAGLRALGLASAMAASIAYAKLVRRHGLSVTLPSEVVFAVGMAVPLLVGEITFLAGMVFGLWGLVAADHRRTLIAASLALLCTIASPLAGLFLALALVAWALSSADRRRPLGVLVVAAAPLAISAVGFREAGLYSFTFPQLTAVLVCSGLGWAITPARLGPQRIAFALYGLAGLVLFVIPNPVGGNWVRLGSYFAPALVVATCWPSRKRLLASVLLPTLFWQWSTGVYAMADARGDPTRSASYFQPLVQKVDRLPKPSRLEIPFTGQHWEASYVATRVPLARGWERQLDQSNNSLFYDTQPLTPTAYRQWLYDNGITWVALPDAPLDTGGKKEAALLSHGLSYLQPVWKNAHWTLWRVKGSPGLVSGPAQLSLPAPDRFSLTASRAGTVTVRLHYTRAWTVTQGTACIERAPGGWTTVQVPRPGTVTVVARPFTAAQDCPEGPRTD